jgi:hypothetical protein
MFRMNAETCCASTIAEVLILAAVNVESTRLTGEGRVRREAAATRGKLSATQVLRTNVRKALQV